MGIKVEFMMTSGNYESNQEIDLTTLDRNKSGRKNRIVTTAAALGRLKVFALLCVAAAGCAAPQPFKVRLETSQALSCLLTWIFIRNRHAHLGLRSGNLSGFLLVPKVWKKYD